jgi:hypothetical protein
MATTYTDAPIEEMANKLIEKYEELEDCFDAKIKFLFKESEKSSYIGKCSKATGKWKFLTGDLDYVVEVWEPFWNVATDKQKEALLYHELRHIEKKIKENDDGEETVTWKVRKHHEEIFADEIEHFGAWNDGLSNLMGAFLAQNIGKR